MNTSSVEIINRVLPILLLILMGFGLRRTGFLSEEIIEGFKKIVVNIAPPPFIIPLFMRRDLDEERRFVNNVLAVYTLVTIVAFTINFTLNPVLG